MRNLEQELKLQLDEREYGIIAALTDKKPQLQINYYFSSRYITEDTMVRVREKQGVYLLCCKVRLKDDQAVTVCDERECEISAEFVQSMLKRGIMPSEINGMLGTDFDEALAYAGKLETYRTAFDLEEWHLELDKNIYFDKCDYELECESTFVQQLYKLKNYLSYNYGIVIRESSPKSLRFFEAKRNAKI